MGRSTDKRYLVRTEPDGTMIFTPATVVPKHLLGLLDRPDILATFKHAEEHPETLVRRELRKASDVDWEHAD